MVHLLGILVFKLIYNYFPFYSNNFHITELIINEEPNFPKSSTNFQKSAESLIKELLIKDPKQRLGAKSLNEIKNHPFFKNIDEKNIYFVSEKKKSLIIKGGVLKIKDNTKKLMKDKAKIFYFIFFYVLHKVILSSDGRLKLIDCIKKSVKANILVTEILKMRADGPKSLFIKSTQGNFWIEVILSVFRFFL